MGKGLGINPDSDGVHLAFTAGTGILVFIDLVMRIFLQNIGVLPEGYERFPANFKFILYGSFPDKASGCCVDMCEKVSKFCKMFGFQNFELYLRLSKVKNEFSERWDKTFLHTQLGRHLVPKTNDINDERYSLINESVMSASDISLSQSTMSKVSAVPDKIDLDDTSVVVSSDKDQGFEQMITDIETEQKKEKGAFGRIYESEKGHTYVKRIWVCGPPVVNE